MVTERTSINAYLLRNIPPDLWAKVKDRSESEGHRIRWVLLRLLEMYVTRGLK